MIKIFDEDTDEWIVSTTLSPYSVNFRLDESLDSAVVERIVNSKQTLKPLTKVILVDGIHEHNFVVQNARTSLIGISTYLQTIDLDEPTVIAQGIPLDTITFSQPLNPDELHPIMMLDEVIDRILKITPTTLLSEDNSLAFQFELDPAIRQLFHEVESPEFFFTEFTLFDALVAIGAYLDMFPRIKFGYFEINRKLMITFDELDVENKYNYIVNKENTIETQQPLGNYANEVITNVSNLSIETEVMYPPTLEDGFFVSSIDNGTVITDDNAVLIAPEKFKKITKLYIKVDWGNDDFVSEWSDVTDYIKEYGVWQTLTPLDVTVEPDTPHSERQIYTCYYKYNDDKIYNLKSFVTKLFHYAGYPTPVLRATLFRIKYVPYVNVKLKEKNKAKQNYSVIYNQNNNIIESNTYGKNLKNYIKRMEHGDEVISKIYYDLADLPKIGHNINTDYVLTNLSYTKYNNHYDVTMQLSKNYTRRAEFIRAKNEIRTWEIPADGNVVDRKTSYQENVNLSFGVPIPNTKDLTIKFNHFNFLNGGGYPNMPNLTYKSGKYTAYLNFKTKNEVIPLKLVPSTGTINNQVFFHIKGIDNTLIGFQKVINWDRKVNNQVGVTYTDSYGQFETVDVCFALIYNLNFDIKKTARTYPVSTQIDNNDVFNNLSNFRSKDIVIKNDAREVFNLTYLINLVGVNNSVIHKNFALATQGSEKIEDLSILKVCFLNKKIYNQAIEVSVQDIITSLDIKYFDYPYSDDEEYYEYGVDETLVPVNYQSIALAFFKDDNYKFIIIQNEPSQTMTDLLSDEGKLRLYVNY